MTHAVLTLSSSPGVDRRPDGIQAKARHGKHAFGPPIDRRGKKGLTG
jgi:hypothetical protein